MVEIMEAAILEIDKKLLHVNFEACVRLGRQVP